MDSLDDHSLDDHSLDEKTILRDSAKRFSEKAENLKEIINNRHNNKHDCNTLLCLLLFLSLSGIVISLALTLP